MRFLLAVLSMLLPLAAWAEDAAQVSVCFDYGCAVIEQVMFSAERMGFLRDFMSQSDDASSERLRLALAVGFMYRWAAEQTPIGADRGGNLADDGVHGRMDCIDHSRSTTGLLQLLQSRRLLRHHRVEAPVRRNRWLIQQHFAAAVAELGDDAAPGTVYVVDTWFRDNGRPAVILPLREWMNGEGGED